MAIKEIEFLPPKINEKYTEITSENGRVVLPCWFVRPGNTMRNFLVKGRVKGGFGTMESAMRVLVSVDYSLMTSADQVVDVTINNSGDIQKIYDVEIPVENSGEFEFKITLSVRRNADLSKPHRISIKYNARTKYKRMKFFEQETAYEESNQGMLDLFVRSELNNSNTWIGLDPGTSGSCVCIGRGGSKNNPNICHLGEGIIPSVVVLPRSTRVKDDFRDYQPGDDYLYGDEARQQWTAEINNGARGFVSIKKLLGYNSEDRIPVRLKDRTAYFSGAEVAHLLIKGIDRELKQSIDNFSDVERSIYTPQGQTKCERLVVAIPNNYTLPKILDMVRSIQWLNQYEEVRYIYEPEAVIFNYLMKEYQGVAKHKSLVAMVFDMGGATINVSVYELSISGRDDGSDSVRVKTLGKVGYAVGGDNIDFALLESLIELYVGSRKNRITDEHKNKFELQKKNELLPKIFELKLALIDAVRHKRYEGVFSSSASFILFVNKCFELLRQWGYKEIDEDFLKIYLNIHDDPVWEDYRETIIQYLLNSAEIKQYVYERIDEAVEDVMSFVDNMKIDTLIFSGRSVLFPGVKEHVKHTLNQSNDIEWNGLDDNEIKSAVAYGACWYGMYSTSIQLDNELITSSYGYGMTTNGRYTFVPIIRRGSIFDEKGKCDREHDLNSSFNADANLIKFYQMMGRVEDCVFDENKKKYKRVYLGDIQAYTNTRKLSMEIDRNDNLCYRVVFEDDGIAESDLKKSLSRDIVDDNDRAYYFATMATPQQDVSCEDKACEDNAEEIADSRNFKNHESSGKEAEVENEVLKNATEQKDIEEESMMAAETEVKQHNIVSETKAKTKRRTRL